jgi:hypothetical protein
MKPLLKPSFGILQAAILLPAAMLGMSESARSAITIQSYWSLGEGASIGLDTSSSNDGEVNNFNNTTGTVVNTTSPSGVNGSTAYASTSGANFQGIWMFGAGSDSQTVPADNWGVQFMVRSTNTASIATVGAFRAVYGMFDAAAGGLVIEARRHSDGNVYWDVNRSAEANLIIPRNSTTLVTNNAWTNLALVRSGGILYFYVDGEEAGNTNLSIGSTDGLLALGFQQGVGTNNLIGDFDEASFFTFGSGEFNPDTDLLIPEPAAALLGGLGLLTILRRRR